MSMPRYAHVFFDLDHTLWDFRANSRATLAELYSDLELEAAGVPSAAELIACYEEVNEMLWARYEAGHLPKDVLRVLRFRNTLMHFGVHAKGLANTMGHEYLERCPRKSALMPGTSELLQELHGRMRMHIITNGFQEVQAIKLTASGIGHYFDVVLTSEAAGASKPDPRIFARALRDAKASPEQSIMVGDNALADMAGARQAGWDHVHFAAETEPDPMATHRITHMAELRKILL